MADIGYYDSDAAPSGYTHPFMSWRSVVAGLLVTLLTFAILTTLGMAIGGHALNEVVEGGGAQTLGIGAGVWLIVTVLISLFVGSYFSGSISSFVARRSGIAHGLTIAAIFFVLFLYQMGVTLSSAVSGVGNLVGSGASAVASQADKADNLAQTPLGQEVVGKITRELNLQSPPDQVAQGVATRLIRGDEEGAKNYLAMEAGITPEEADRRIQETKADIQAGATQVGKTASNVLAGAGWTLFLMMVLGTLSACMGGALGSRATLRRPVRREVRPRIGDTAPVGI